MKIAFGEARKLCKEASAAIGDAIAGPAVKSRFNEFEQSVRNQMASTIRSMREQAKAANVAGEVQLRLYGPQQAAKDVEQVKTAATAIKEQTGKGGGGILD